MIPPETRPDRRAGWTEPLPRRLPRPTWSPFALALGLIILARGVVASGVVLAIGVAVALAAAVAWVRELGHELRER